MVDVAARALQPIGAFEHLQADSQKHGLRAYDCSKPIVSLHIPKTAGVSFRATLNGWFGADGLHLHYRGSLGEAPERLKLGAGDCVHGHFNRVRGLGALAYYPKASQFITFLRDPFDRFVSQWRYLHFQQRHAVNIPALDDSPTFEQWFERRAKATASGEDPFSFIAQLPWPVSAENADKAFDRGYVAVGITEKYDVSVRAIALALGFPPPQVTVHVNRADDAHRQGDPTDDYGAWRAAHREAFAIEYTVYEAACRSLAASLQAAALRLPLS